MVDRIVMGKGRQDSILKYCKERGLKVIKADPGVTAAYERSAAALIPKILEAQKRQARLVHEFRDQLLF